MASGGAGLARTSARSSRSTRLMLPRRRSSSWPAAERCPPRRPSPPFASSTSTRRSSTRSLSSDLSLAVRARAPAVTRLLDPCPELVGGRVESLRTVEGSSPSSVDGTRSRPAPAMRNQGRWSMGYEKTTETVERDPRDVHDETWTETKVTDHGTKDEGGKEAIGAGTEPSAERPSGWPWVALPEQSSVVRSAQPAARWRVNRPKAARKPAPVQVVSQGAWLAQPSVAQWPALPARSSVAPLARPVAPASAT